MNILTDNEILAGIEEVPQAEDRSLASKAGLSNGDSPAPLWNRKGPNVMLQQERPIMRMAVELTAKGYKPDEIAARLNVTRGTVINWLRQPSINEKVPGEIRRVMGADEEVVEIIKDNVAKAVQALCDIALDPDEKASSRIAAANSLLDRRYGKPNQPINRGTDVDLNTLSDEELLQMHTTSHTSNTKAA